MKYLIVIHSSAKLKKNSTAMARTSAQPKGDTCFLRARHSRTPPPFCLYETLAFRPPLASAPNECLTSKPKPHDVVCLLFNVYFMNVHSFVNEDEIE